MKIRSSLHLLAAVCLMFTAGCFDSQGPDDVFPYRLEVVSGAGQRGLSRERLPASVVVRVSDPGSKAVSGVSVRFEVREGGGSAAGSAVTDRAGLVSANWTLGDASSPQKLVVLSVDDEFSAVSVGATALRVDETDVVIARGALGPMMGLLVMSSNEGVGNLDLLQERPWTDTVMPIQPIDGGNAEVLVFGTANPPVRRSIRWTPGVDTVYADLRPRLELDLVISIWVAPYDERKAVVDLHLSKMEETWYAEGMAVKLGQVTFNDLTDRGDSININAGNNPCVPDERPTAVSISYIHTINNGGVGGLGCAPDRVFMARNSERSPQLLTHEMGHVFGLQHRNSGVMFSPNPGSTFTVGEIFRAHFQAFSALNAILNSQPDWQENCGPITPCLPSDYEFPEAVGR